MNVLQHWNAQYASVCIRFYIHDVHSVAYTSQIIGDVNKTFAFY